MSLSNYKDLVAYSNVKKIDAEITNLSKTLFNLRLKRLTHQAIKPHEFKHIKRKIAQLTFKKSRIN
jgi:large subunit ribosomal protein L29